MTNEEKKIADLLHSKLCDKDHFYDCDYYGYGPIREEYIKKAQALLVHFTFDQIKLFCDCIDRRLICQNQNH